MPSEGDWSDDAFDRLPSLKLMEKSIKENSHLYGMPSAKELKEREGIDLLGMDALLLEKIEWLYQYTIDQEKRIELLESRLKDSESDE